jgi:hypothetical protein
MILGLSKGEKITQNEDIDIIMKKDNKNIIASNGNKPIPKNIVKPFKLLDDPSEDKFIKNMKNILKQSNRDIKNIKIKKNCQNECSRICVCKKK